LKRQKTDFDESNNFWDLELEYFFKNVVKRKNGSKTTEYLEWSAPSRRCAPLRAGICGVSEE
jgi:hypothetical protein